MKLKWRNEDIVEAISSGKSKRTDLALKYVYYTCFKSAKNYVLKNGGGHEDASDVFQDAVMVFYNMVKANKFRQESSIKTLIYAISRNIWLNKLKSQPEEVMDTSDLELSIDYDWYENETNINKLLKDTMDQMGGDCKELLASFYFDKSSMSQIMLEFGLGSEQAARTKKYRCMQQLMKLFKAKGITKEQVFG